MANVTGPISTLPGYTSVPPKGTMCDYHDEVPAVGRVQGETDSFGSEQEDLCQACLDEQNKRIENETIVHTCELCKTPNVEVRHARDMDEGMYGPVYMWCRSCIIKQNREALDELEYLDKLDNNGG